MPDTGYSEQYQKQPMATRILYVKEDYRRVTRKLQYDDLGANVWQVQKALGECRRNT